MDFAARHHASHRAALAYIARCQPRGAVVERDGVTASVDPDRPTRSLFNSVVYDEPGALEAALPELARVYDDAGVLAWTVWVKPADTVRLAPVLEAAGHALDATPELMGAPVEAVVAGAEHRVGPVDAAACGALNDLAYGLDEGTFAGALARLGAPELRWFGVVREGGVVACAGTYEHEDDCWITFVATHPGCRGEGLGGAVVAAGVRDSSARGCTTTTLEATQLGRPAYRRIGYQEFGAIQMWERRKASAATS